ncbi:histidine phosphatase family protein [Candidatus Saccharibacteria bacterium]|nr:histidine phosphatase family protein [Candidatus Saccharibacteria bacterium]
MIKFYFVRHGQSEANAARLIADSTPKLTKLGREQAIETANSLKDIKITKILTSPLIRARQTAEIIASELGLHVGDIEVVDELTERSLGECEGKPKDMESEKYITIDTERGFEPQATLIKRLLVALEMIKKECNDASGNVLVVGHVTAGFYLQQLAKGYRKITEFDEYYHMPNAVCKEVEIND